MDNQPIDSRMYDNFCQSEEFQRRCMEFEYGSYWGYKTPKRMFDTDIKFLYTMGEFWNEKRMIELHKYLESLIPHMRRVFKKNGIADYYAAMHKRGVGGYSAEAGADLQLIAETFLTKIRVVDCATPSQPTTIMLNPRSSWAVLQMIVDGIVPEPDTYIQPPIIAGVISGDVTFK